ncbi:zinc finger protein 800 [Chelonus insularis]|uniref:zinc finger protein 800 n=1 Tax=Chelonus insularis TaxID=460826 RepID=UPI00158D9E6A|nr:zinc finger protein 800 [Chelonus insularis]
MKAKTKTKKNDRKFNRVKFDAKDPPIVETPTCDSASLRKPIDTSLCSLRQVTKLFETGSEEIKCILTYECDVIYECKICRSLFRSLLNFISHKRVYCPEKFNILCDKSAINPPTMSIDTTDPESKENCKNERPIKNQDTNKKFPKKDLTSVISMLQQKQKDPDYDETKEQNNRMHIIADTEQVLLEVMESNKAAFQTVLEPTVKNIDSEDLMKAQTTELQTILSRDTAILGPDGQVIEVGIDEKCDDPLQFSERQGNILNNDIISNDNLVCSICNTRFSTKKTLKFHMKSLHTSDRLVYPCPSCTSLFPSSWGVYRHLLKVHRKSNAQVRKLRTEIQAKAHKRKTTRAQDMEKDCAESKLNDLSEPQSLTNQTQEWMAHLESDGELQRCGGCGKRFDRKAALQSHSQTCQRRLAACNGDVAIKSKRKPVSEMIPEHPRAATPASAISLANANVENNSITLKDNSVPSLEPIAIPATSPPKSNSLLRIPNISSAVTITPLNQEESTGISIRVEGISSLSKDAWDKIGTEMSDIVPDPTPSVIPSESMQTDNNDGDKSDDPEIIFTKIEKTKTNISGSTGSKKRKMENIANLHKLECVPCKRKFSNLPALRRHMAEHINWYRYHCKLCNFKCIDKIDSIAHCNKIHNAKNSRISIANMISETPINHQPSNSSRSLLKRKNVQKEPLELEVIDVTAVSTSTDESANTNQETGSMQNGVSKVNSRAGKNNKIDDKSSSDSDTETPDKMSEVAKKARLDEDPELRRMVMEVIFGSTEVGVNEKPRSSSESTRMRMNRASSENRSNSSSDSEPSSVNSNTNQNNESLKSDSRHSRATRNRTKFEDKDFIYDLDAVLLKEPVEEDLCSIKITNDKPSANVINNTKINSDDLTIVLRKDDVVSENKLGKVA